MSCITYINNDPNGVPVTVSGTTCSGVVGNYIVNFGQAICMDNDFEIITCGNADIGAECLPQITPSVTPTISLTPSITASSTPTTTPTNTPTPSVTIGLTPTSTPELTSTPTQTGTLQITPTPTTTPTLTSSITPTPTQTGTLPTTPTPTSTIPVTPTSTPSGELFIYARYVNSTTELGYSLNGGVYLGIGDPPSTNCEYIAVITNLQIGDVLDFTTINSCGVGGDTSDCPSISGCLYQYTFNGTANIYITVDGSTCC